MENSQESSFRSVKVRGIFNKFDRNRDGCLNRQELRSLIIAVNPRVKFSEAQIEAILDELYRTYGEFIDGDRGLSFAGLLQTYEDGAGNVDRDFDTLQLQFPGQVVAEFKERVLPLVPNADDRQANTTLSTLEVSFTDSESILNCMTDLAKLVGSNSTLTHVQVSQQWGYAFVDDLDFQGKIAMQSTIQERKAVESKLRGELERMLNNELRRNTTLQTLGVGSWKLLRVGDGHEWQMTYEGPCLARELGECLAEYYDVRVKR